MKKNLFLAALLLFGTFADAQQKKLIDHTVFESWKTIKAFAEERGVICVSPLSCFKEAYHQNLISYNDTWIKELVETRNKTVHTYDEKLAEEVYNALPNILQSFQELLLALKST